MKPAIGRLLLVACGVCVAKAAPLLAQESTTHGPPRGSVVLHGGDRDDLAARQPETRYSSKRMLDRKEWLTRNVDVNVQGSYCYQDDEAMCRRLGRLYTWEAARRACQSLPGAWRLPTDEEWRRLAKPYGGVNSDSADGGRSAYASLVQGGKSGFSALLGGGRSPDGREYDRLDAHGFYWTASQTRSDRAVFMNFGRGSAALYRQPEGEKEWAFSVRCVKEND